MDDKMKNGAGAGEDLQAKLRSDAAKKRKPFGEGKYAKEFSFLYLEHLKKNEDDEEKAETEKYAEDQLKEKGEWALFQAKKNYHIKSLRERNENRIYRREAFRERIERVAEDVKKSATAIGLAGGWLIVMILIIVLMVGVIGSFFGTETEDGKSVAIDPVVGVAKTQVGQVGGKPYWKWYGFNQRVEWCAIFTSWCAEQCDYIKKGIMPKFSLVSDGMNWYKGKGAGKPRRDTDTGSGAGDQGEI